MIHPKLRMGVDVARTHRAHKNLVVYLKGIDPNERRKTKILGVLGVVSFNLIAVAIAFIALLMWRVFL